MKISKIFFGIVAALALMVGIDAQAATLDSALTAGEWSTSQDKCGDVRCVVKATKLTNSVSNTASLELPGNMLGQIKLQVEGQTLNANGISPSYTLYPLPASFSVDGVTGSYTDTVSRSFPMSDVTSAAATTSASLDVGQRLLTVSGGSTISTSEVLQVRVLYQVPASARTWR